MLSAFNMEKLKLNITFTFHEKVMFVKADIDYELILSTLIRFSDKNHALV